jgi:ankyrin repeat protein
MNVLIDHGVNVNQKIREGTLLHLASERGQTAVVQILLANEAKLNIRNSKGKTALEVAMANGNQKAAYLITRETVKRREVGKSSEFHIIIKRP